MSKAESDAGLVGRWKIGALAAATGLTVRALHHYDSVGLLNASGRTAAGHRIYSAQDVARLYQIQFLRRLDLLLAEITRALDDPNWDIREAIRLHVQESGQRLTVAARLHSRLQSMSAQIDQNHNPTTRDLLAALEDMTMLDSAVHNTTALLVYEEIEAAQEYLTRVYGLIGGELERDDSGAVKHGEVRAGTQVIWLHGPGKEFQSPITLGGVSGMTMINVEDVDEHYRKAVAAGADIIEDPIDQPYGAREYGARDLEGQLWFFHSPIDS